MEPQRYTKNRRLHNKRFHFGNATIGARGCSMSICEARMFCMRVFGSPKSYQPNRSYESKHSFPPLSLTLYSKGTKNKTCVKPTFFILVWREVSCMFFVIFMYKSNIILLFASIEKRSQYIFCCVLTICVAISFGRRVDLSCKTWNGFLKITQIVLQRIKNIS